MNADDIAKMGLNEVLTVLSARMDEYDRLAKGHRAAPHWGNEEMARLAVLHDMIECLKARRTELGAVCGSHAVASIHEDREVA